MILEHFLNICMSCSRKYWGLGVRIWPLLILGSHCISACETKHPLVSSVCENIKILHWISLLSNLMIYMWYRQFVHHRSGRSIGNRRNFEPVYWIIDCRSLRRARRRQWSMQRLKQRGQRMEEEEERWEIRGCKSTELFLDIDVSIPGDTRLMLASRVLLVKSFCSDCEYNEFSLNIESKWMMFIISLLAALSCRWIGWRTGGRSGRGRICSRCSSCSNRSMDTHRPRRAEYCDEQGVSVCTCLHWVSIVFLLKICLWYQKQWCKKEPFSFADQMAEKKWQDRKDALEALEKVRSLIFNITGLFCFRQVSFVGSLIQVREIPYDEFVFHRLRMNPN